VCIAISTRISISHLSSSASRRLSMQVRNSYFDLRESVSRFFSHAVMNAMSFLYIWHHPEAEPHSNRTLNHRQS